MDYKEILKIVPGLQATSLVAYNVPKFSMRPSKKMMSPKKIVKKGVGTIVGIGLLKPTAEFINAL